MGVRDYIEKNAGLKGLILWLVVHPVTARPRWYISWFVNPFVHKKAWSSKMAWGARLDVLPFNAFTVGEKTVVEAGSVINNGVGDVVLGAHSLVGLRNTIIGPVHIGNHVILAQNVVMSGLNHGYADVSQPIKTQGVITAPIVINDECWIGANAVITAGVTVGKHSVVAAGSIVTKDVPAYSIVGGNPAKLLKAYDKETESWQRV